MEKSIKTTSLVAFLAILIPYLLGLLFPDTWWSTHFFQFLDLKLKLVFSILFLALIYLAFSKKSLNITKPLHLKKLPLTLVVIGYVILIFAFPMIEDFYGDAYKYFELKTNVLTEVPKGTLEALLSYSLNPAAGEQTILALVTYFTYFFETSYSHGFNIMNGVFGGLYVYTWVSFVNARLKLSGSKILWICIGLFAPFSILFFGHLEIYAPVYFFCLWWIVTALNYFKEPEPRKAFLLFILLIVCIKVHGTMLLFVPAYIYLLIQPKIKSKPQWKTIAIYGLIPIFIAGLVIYFFVFGDHIDDRSFRQGTIREFDHLFLPLFSPEAPLDRYNMFSFNHIFDYFQLLFCWSPVALFLLAILITKFRTRISWEAPQLVLAGIALILFSALMFAINPLLSIPIDWDLLSIPGIILLVFTLLLFAEVESEIGTQHIVFKSFAVLLISMAIFPVHQNRNALANRLASVAYHVNKTYYEWTAQIVSNSLKTRNKNPNYIKRNQVIIEKMRPYSLKGIDYEFSSLLHEQGKASMRSRKYDQAIAYYKEALDYYPENNRAKLKLLEPYFLKKDFNQAYIIAKELTDIGYPSPQKAHRVALHCALEVEDYKEALRITSYYTSQWNDDFIERVHKKLVKGDSLPYVKQMFVGSK